MMRWLLDLLGFGGTEGEGRQLARDARAIIEMIHGQHAAPSLQKIALKSQECIGEVHERGMNDPKFYKRGVEHLTDLNRAAKNRRDNISWSGITLAIIYVRAEMIGDDGLAAKHAIQGFFEEWAHITDDGAEGADPSDSSRES